MSGYFSFEYDDAVEGYARADGLKSLAGPFGGAFEHVFFHPQYHVYFCAVCNSAGPNPDRYTKVEFVRRFRGWLQQHYHKPETLDPSGVPLC